MRSAAQPVAAGDAPAGRAALGGSPRLRRGTGCQARKFGRPCSRRTSPRAGNRRLRRGQRPTNLSLIYGCCRYAFICCEKCMFPKNCQCLQTVFQLSDAASKPILRVKSKCQYSFRWNANKRGQQQLRHVSKQDNRKHVSNSCIENP